MKKNILFCSLLFLISFSFSAKAFDPKNISRSLVKITIFEKDKPTLTASGFIYNDNTSIITSLHVMRPGPNIRIKIEYGNQSCLAKIVKVHQRADLVLLKAMTDPDLPAATLPSWTPISAINTNPLQFAENIYSIGYNSGSRSWISRKLSKGSGASEKLNDLIPAKDVAQIRNIGMPHLDLNVIYIDGSLLPGFSGAPLLNEQGQLVGIADGGLENGASNVSWGIPCREIGNLFSSTITSLPSSITSASVVYSAEINAPQNTSVIHFKDYQFIHTKTRTLQELIDRSDDQKTLHTWLESFNEINVDYSAISFDVYEDIINGFIITVPHGKRLAIENDVLSAQLNKNDEQLHYLVYSPGNMIWEQGEQLSYAEMEEGQKELANYFKDSLQLADTLMVVEDRDEYKIKKLSNGYLATSGYSIQSRNSTPEHPIYASYIYCKFIITHESSLVCITYLNDYSNENMQFMMECVNQKADCSDRNSECQYSCRLAHDWIQILASVNLTTVAANK